MQIQSVNNTNFGTRYGKNLTKFIEENKEILTHENLTNISKIRNNGINSVLELEEASSKDKELFKSTYNLNLTDGIFDRVNYYMNWGGTLHRGFQNKIRTILQGKNGMTKNPFPISINGTGEDINRNIAKQFDSKNMLAEKIEKEFEKSKIIEDEFKKISE